jgi:hypothetical protein
MWGMTPAELIAEWFATLDLPHPVEEYTDEQLAAEATSWNLTTLPYRDAVEAISAYRKEH